MTTNIDLTSHKYWRTIVYGTKAHITKMEPKPGGKVFTFCGLTFNSSFVKEQVTEILIPGDCLNCWNSVRVHQKSERRPGRYAFTKPVVKNS